MGSIFGVPGMLFWGGAISIPILIHLFARQRYKKVPWAAMGFLLKAFKKTRSRIRLEHLLLLLLRILAILFFTLFLASPKLSPTALLGGPDARREVVIIMDDSFSMALTEADGSSPMVRAKSQANKLISSLQQERGDGVTLITAGKPARLRLKGVTDLDAVRKALDEIEVGAGATDYLGAFRTVVATLEDLDEGAEVWMLSDLQKVGFVPPSEGIYTDSSATPDRAPGIGDPPAGSTPTAPAEAQQLLSSLLSQIKSRKALVHVLSGSDSPTENVGIIGVEKRSKVVVTGMPAVVSVTLRNFGVRPQSGMVSLYVDGGSVPIDQRAIERIAPGAVTAIDFRHTFRNAGSHYVEAKFASDNLLPDNRRALALEVRRKIKTLIVDGDPNPEPGEEESFFINAALNPGGVSSETSIDNAFEAETVQEINFNRKDLKDTDLLVLMDVALISGQRATEIQRFVEEGGGLLVYLGDKTQPESLNSRLWKGGTGVLPAKLLGSVGEDSLTELAYGITNPDVEHPALSYFNDPAILPWLSYPPVFKYFRMDVPKDDPNVRVLAELDRPGASLPRPEPLIVERTLGKGKVLMVATAGGDREWNDLAVFPTWLLMNREFAYYLTRREERLENLMAGSTYERVLRSFVREAVVSKDGDQISIVNPLALEGDRGYELKTGILREAGVYRLDLQRQQDQEIKDPNPLYVAVNVDPVESDLSRVDRDFITSSFPGVIWMDDIESEEEGGTTNREGFAWWWALLLAGVMLGLETLLSQLFGLRSRGMA